MTVRFKFSNEMVASYQRELERAVQAEEWRNQVASVD
jgi:hypothetical protein